MYQCKLKSNSPHLDARWSFCQSGSDSPTADQSNVFVVLTDSFEGHIRGKEEHRVSQSEMIITLCLLCHLPIYSPILPSFIFAIFEK